MNLSGRTKTKGIQKISYTPLREVVYEQIKNLILLNKIYPGQIIVIDHLATEMGLSQTPVREALVKLELDGLVTTNQYRNPRVADIRSNDVEELYDMRLLVEPWGLQHSFNNFLLTEIMEIERELNHAHEQASNENFLPHVEADIRLHKLILSSTGNAFFWQLASRVSDHSIRIRTLFEATGSKQEIRCIVEEHLLIVKAIKNKDYSTAAESLYQHLIKGKIRTLEALNRLPEGLELALGSSR